MKSLAGKTVVLTGASRGIGTEISKALAAEGAHLIGIARNQTQLAQWAQQMSAYGVQVGAIAFDLSHTNHLTALAEEINNCAEQIASSTSNQGTSNQGTPNQGTSNQGSAHVDILINNAGIEIYSAFQDYTLADIESVISVNLLAAMGLTKLLLPRFSAEAHIVNMASLAAKKAHPFDSVYAASKAGLLMWNHSLRQELTGTGIGVSAICPGYVSDVGMLADTGDKAPFLAGRSRSPKVAQAVLRAIKRNRAEVIINQDPLTEATTRALLAIEQLFPRLNDLSNRWLGITQTNRQRAMSELS